jgi:NADH dehydrogenase
VRPTQRIVILGGGFAGMNVARALERGARRDEVAVTVVNRENYMLFTPMLPEVASGSIEPRHIAPSLRSVLPKSVFELGDATAVDFAKRAVTVRKRRSGETVTLPFDQLVLALGSESSTDGVPGAQAHTFPLETLQDAVNLRDVAITSLENAATSDDEAERRGLTTFVVVGGGFTGVEAAGELLAYLRVSARFYPTIAAQSIRVVLVAGSDRLLEQLPPALGTQAQRMLGARGVEIVLSDEAASVDAGGITLASRTRFESRCVIWSAGVRPATLAERLGVPHAKHEAIAVNPDLSVKDMPGVWALGDCADVPKPGGGAYPRTAQHAVREAKLLARNMLAKLRGRRTKPFAYRSLGMMASLGAHQGLGLLGGRFALSGLPAWLLWRAYYLWQLPGTDRKARVGIDWGLDFPFPSDIASVR